MATKIKIITAGEFVEVTPEGQINLATSRQLLIDIAKTDHRPVDYELFVDFRHTELALSEFDVYQLASELIKHGEAFRRKVALLVLPGVEFDCASFFETCAHNRGFLVNAFTDYEKAMRWILSTDDAPDAHSLSQKPETAGRKQGVSPHIKRTNHRADCLQSRNGGNT